MRAALPLLCRSLLLGIALAGSGACTPGIDPRTDSNPLAAAKPSLVLSGTGFFINSDGYMLTAAHVVEGCGNLYITKDGRTLRPKLVALSRPSDLAILKIDETLGLPAAFVRSTQIAANDLVFAASHAVLQEVGRGGASVLSNAVVVANVDSGAGISLVSNASEGTSGAPVINSRGLVVGIVTQRTDRAHVKATSAQSAKTFLSANNVAFEQDDQSQLGALQDRAARAATVSVGVVCFKGA